MKRLLDSPTLQRLQLRRATSIARYLAWSSPPWEWSASLARCPLCGRAVFLALEPMPFMTRCLSCRATVIGVSLIPVIEQDFARRVRQRRSRDLRAYELSTYGATLAFLQQRAREVVTSEYFPSEPLGELCDGVLNQDVQRLTFGDETFDLITSNQVFEHVPDDLRGFRECFRTLKSGGALIFAVPLHDEPSTEPAARVENGEIVWLGEPEYHDSRLGGARSAPTFWHHSRHDISRRVAEAGFSHVQVVDVTVTPIQVTPAPVIYALKA